MIRNSVQAKVKRGGNRSTGLLIRTGDLVIETQYTELVACAFPVPASAPIHVEIPPNGVKSFVACPSPSAAERPPADADYPHLIKFPVYQEQEVTSAERYQQLPSDANGNILTKIPIVAIATGMRGVLDGKVVQTHCVLPIWNDGSAVLVRLDWLEGEPSEGTPNSEWHMGASTGLPAALGLRQLERAARLPSNAQHCRYELHLTPWLLAAQLLNDKGQEASDKVWRRQWQFESFEGFSSALACITGQLMGPTPQSQKDAA